MDHRIIICHSNGEYEHGWVRDIFFAEIKGGKAADWLKHVVAIWRVKRENVIERPKNKEGN